MNKLKKVVSFFLVVIMVIGLFPQGVMAKSYRFYYSKLKIEYASKEKRTYTYTCLDTKEKTKITKVVLKDKKLAEVVVTKNKKCISITPKKAGNTTMTVYVKYGSKTKKHKVELNIKKYKNPLTKFKLGGVDYKKHFSDKMDPMISTFEKEKKVKLEVAVKKGYEITSIKYTYKKKNKSKSIVLKNNKRFNLYPINGNICIEVKNKKTGEVEWISLWFLENYNENKFQLKPAG